MNLHSLWNLSTKVLPTFLHKAIQLYPFRVITHLFGHGIIRGRRITTQQNFQPSPSSDQQVLSALHRAMPLAWVGKLHSCYLLTFDVSFVNLCTLESDPTKALPKDSSLSSYSLHKLHFIIPTIAATSQGELPLSSLLCSL